MAKMAALKEKVDIQVERKKEENAAANEKDAKEGNGFQMKEGNGFQMKQI